VADEFATYYNQLADGFVVAGPGMTAFTPPPAPAPVARTPEKIAGRKD
jgi:putative intracellular protease/amidase